MHTIDQLNDGREVYLNGKQINVADIDIFRKTLNLNNEYYKLQKSNPKVHTYQEIAQTNYVMLRRTPDFLDTGMVVIAE